VTPTPIIIVAGEARSGKDTVADHIAQKFNGVCVAQADPMKRFCEKVFGFTNDQLWGDAKDKIDPETVYNKNSIVSAFEREIGAINSEVMSKVVPVTATNAVRTAQLWFEHHIWNNLVNDIPISPRLVLQTFGTEFGRKVSRDMWSNYTIKTCRELLAGGYRYTRASGLVHSADLGYNVAIVTDGRFRNEVLNVKAVGGIALKIIRPKNDAHAAVEQNGAKDHASEKELGTIPRHFFDGEIVNGGSLLDLYQSADDAVWDHFGQIGA
jgi:hypothetical protein